MAEGQMANVVSCAKFGKGGEGGEEGTAEPVNETLMFPFQHSNCAPATSHPSHLRPALSLSGLFSRYIPWRSTTETCKLCILATHVLYSHHFESQLQTTLKLVVWVVVVHVKVAYVNTALVKGTPYIVFTYMTKSKLPFMMKLSLCQAPR